jgi:RNA polymerase sigma factor (sigma-70 family)
VVKEQLKRIKARVSLQDMRQVQQPMTDAEEREKLLTILDECLDELPPTEKQLLFAYYLPEKHDRQKLASHQGLSNMTLRVRVHRIRQKLKKAIERKMQIT